MRDASATVNLDRARFSNGAVDQQKTGEARLWSSPVMCDILTAQGRHGYRSLRCRILARMRRLVLPILRRPRPVLFTPM